MNTARKSFLKEANAAEFANGQVVVADPRRQAELM
jgi:hypothetical protein